MPGYERILVASSKGGVGKSTAALGLAAEFARLGKRTLLLDLDVTSRSLDLLTGCADNALFTFADLLSGTSPETAVTRPFPSLPGLMLLPAPASRRLAELQEERGTSAADLIREGFARGAVYAASRLERCGGRAIRLCVCAFDLSAVKKEKRAGVIEMIDASSLQCVGVIPFDPRLQKNQDAGQLPPRQSPVTAACRNIARRLMGYDVRLFDGIPALSRRRRLAL